MAVMTLIIRIDSGRNLYINIFDFRKRVVSIASSELGVFKKFLNSFEFLLVTLFHENENIGV